MVANFLGSPSPRENELPLLAHARRESDKVEPAPLTVTEISARIGKLFQVPAMQSVAIIGEISNYKKYPSGHLYFQLKDSGAEIKCVFFNGAKRKFDFAPADGVQVVALGSIKVYEQKGNYQLYVSELRESGAGALYRKFEELKKKLIAEGLTSPDRKRPLPAFPERIGIVASSESAGLKDMLKVLERRCPLATVVLEAVAVEGEASAPSIARGLERMAKYGNVDVVIVGRGGGSIESLWGFNTELVARAIAAMPVPVISAVGHETDTTIADYVADVRAATPTQAAVLATPDCDEIRARLGSYRRGLGDRMNRRLAAISDRLRTVRSPEHFINIRAQRLDHIFDSVSNAAARRIAHAGRRIEQCEKRLISRSPYRKLHEMETRLERSASAARRVISSRIDSTSRAIAVAGARIAGVSPTAILSRGYSITLKNGKAVKSSKELSPSDHVSLRFAEGSAKAVIE